MSTKIGYLPTLLLLFCVISFFLVLPTFWFLPISDFYILEFSRKALSNYSYRSHIIDITHDKYYPRIICWVCTHPNTKNSVYSSNKLWGQYLDKTIYVSNDTSLLNSLSTLQFPVHEETRRFLWKKTVFSFRYLLTHYGEQYDWFMKADDDTFVVPANLYKFLLKYDPSKPHYFGRELTLNGVTYCSGGGGYIVSRAALILFVNGIDGVCKDQEHGQVEDYEFGRCLNRLGVYPEDSRDSFGRYRFNFFSLRYHYLIPEGKFPKWVYAMSIYPVMNGYNCCASDVITFHYMNIKESVELSKLLFESPKNLLPASKLLKLN